MSALQTLLVTVGVFLLACGMARPQAQPATSSAHARVEWQSRKVTILSTRSGVGTAGATRSEEHTSELQSRLHLVCRLLLEKKKKRSANTRRRTVRPAKTPPPQYSRPPSSCAYLQSLRHRISRPGYSFAVHTSRLTPCCLPL